MSASILELLVGKKIFEYGLNWRIYDSNDNEIFAPPNMRGLGKLGTLEFWQPRRKAKGGKKKRWIERYDKIIIFESEEDLIAFIENEKSENELIDGEEQYSKDIEVISKPLLKQLSKAYNYQQKLYHADQIGDIDRIVAIYKEMQAIEDEDIEFLLIHT